MSDFALQEAGKNIEQDKLLLAESPELKAVRQRAPFAPCIGERLGRSGLLTYIKDWIGNLVDFGENHLERSPYGILNYRICSLSWRCRRVHPDPCLLFGH
jgi:hypothetical protein